MTMPLPLDGVRLVEWSSYLSTPLAGMMLADLGADVIKIEAPTRGDPRPGGTTTDGAPSIGYETVNRNKRSITLNLKSDEGRALLHGLVEKADIFLTSYGQGAASRVGAGSDQLKKVNPELIYAQGSGWGAQAPANRRSFDFMIQGMSGLMWSIGDRESEAPTTMATAMIDMASGSMLAYGVLASILSKERNGVPQGVSTSLLGTMIHLQADNINRYLWTDKPRPRVSRAQARNALVNYYRCADDEWIVICEPEFTRFWDEFAAATGLSPEIADEDRMGPELVIVLDDVFASKPRDAWLEVFEAADCRFGYSPVNRTADVVNDHYVIANGYISEIDHPTMGRTRAVGSPVQLSESPFAMRRPPPEFGQHTEEVLQEWCGLGPDDMDELRAGDVI